MGSVVPYTRICLSHPANFSLLVLMLLVLVFHRSLWSNRNNKSATTTWSLSQYLTLFDNCTLIVSPSERKERKEEANLWLSSKAEILIIQFTLILCWWWHNQSGVDVVQHATMEGKRNKISPERTVGNIKADINTYIYVKVWLILLISLITWVHSYGECNYLVLFVS